MQAIHQDIYYIPFSGYLGKSICGLYWMGGCSPVKN